MVQVILPTFISVSFVLGIILPPLAVILVKNLSPPALHITLYGGLFDSEPEIKNGGRERSWSFDLKREHYSAL